MSISACVIAKEQSRLIEQCLESINHLVDEIIVVDTGDTNNTIKVAKEFNAKVINTKFENDFSKIRNLAIENATKDWILTIDCDESLNVSDLNTLIDIMEEKSMVACSFKLVNVIKKTEQDGPYCVRLFKNHEGFHYKGKRKEQIIDSIYSKYDKASLCTCDIKLYHFK